MKIFDKIKKIILICSLAIGIGLTGYGISKTANAAHNAQYPTVTFSYKAYRKDAYDEYKTTVFNVGKRSNSKKTLTMNDFADIINLLNDPGEYAGDVDAIVDDYGLINDWESGSAVSTGDTAQEQYNYWLNKYTTIKNNFDSAELTALSPGQEIVVEAYAETSTNVDLFQCSAILDIIGMMDSSSTPVKYGNPELNSSNWLLNKMSYGYQLGFSFSSSTAGKLPCPAFLGGVGFKVATNPTTTTIGLNRQTSAAGQTYFSPDGKGTGIDMKNYGDNFKENTLSLSSSSSSETGLDTLTVDGINALSGSGPSYSCDTAVSDGTANISATVKDNGSILSPAYIYTSAPTVPTNGTDSAPSGYDTTASVVSGNFSYSLSDVNTGATVYALFQAQASDQTTKKWYMVSFTKAKSTEAKASITFNSSDSLTWKTSFTNTNTGEYTIYYNPNATNFKVNVTPVDSLVSSMVFNGTQTLSSGIDYEFNSGTLTDGYQCTVKITAQDTDYIKEYKFKFVAANTKPTTVEADSVTAAYDTDSKTYTLDPMPGGKGSFNLKIVLPSGATGVLKHNGTTKANYSNTTTTNNMSYTSTDNSAQTSETYTLEVTNNGVTDTYTIVVKRPKVENDTDFTINAYYVDPDGNTQNLTLTKSSSGNEYNNSANKIPYASKQVKYTITMNNSSSQTLILDGNNTAHNIKGVEQVQSLTIAQAYTDESFSFYVKTALDTANSTNGTKWTIKVYKESPNTTKNMKSLDIYSNTTSANVPTTCRTVSSNAYTYEVDTNTYGTVFKLNLNWEDNTKTKAYASTSQLTINQGTALPSSNVYNLDDTYTLSGESITIYVYLQDEALNTSSYTVIIKKGKNTNSKIDAITIESSEDGSNYSTIFSSFSSTTYSYDYSTCSTLKVPYKTKYIKFTITLNSNASDATVKVNSNATNGTGVTKTYTHTLGTSDTGDITYAVVSTAAAGGTNVSSYNFKINRANGSNNSYIKKVVIGNYDLTSSANASLIKGGNVFDYSMTSTVVYIPCKNFNSNLKNVEVTLDSVYSQAIYTPANGTSGTFTANSTNGGIFNFDSNSSITTDTSYTFTIVVKSEIDLISNGNGTTYTFTVYIASQDHELDDFDVYDGTGSSLLQDSSNNTINKTNHTAYTNSNAFEVGYDDDKIQLDITKPATFCNGRVTYKVGTTAYQEGDTLSLSTGLNKITIIVDSELKIKDPTRTDLSTTYTFYITRKSCAHNSKLSSLSVSIDGSPVSLDKTFASGTNAYKIENLTAGSNITIYYTLADSKSKVLANGDAAHDVTSSGQTLQITSLNYSDTTNSSSETFNINVKCMCGTQNFTVYKITLSTKQVTVSSTPGSITGITANTNKGGLADKLSPAFSSNKNAYKVDLTNDSTDTDAKINVTTDDSKGWIVIEDENGAVLSKTQTDSIYYTVDNVGLDETKVITVKILAEDETPGDSYKITIKRAAAASPDNEPTMFYYNNLAVPGYQKANPGPYSVNIGTATSVKFSADLPTGASFVNNSYWNDFVDSTYTFGANEWSKTITLTVKAEDTTTNSYIFTIYREGTKELDKLTGQIEDTSGNWIHKLNPTYNAAQKKYTLSLTTSESNVLLTWQPKTDNGNVKVELINPDGNTINNLINNGDGTFSYKITNITTTKDAQGNDNPLKYILRLSETINGTTTSSDYEVAISKDRGSDTAYITSYEYVETVGGSYVSLNATYYVVGQTNYDKTNGLYYRVDRNITTFNPKITLNDANAKYILPNNTRLTPGQVNHMQVIVIPASGVDPTGGNNHSYANAVYYTFDVYPCDITYDIDNIYALENQGGNNLLDIDGQTYIDYSANKLAITIANSAANATYLDVKVKTSTINHKIYLNGSLMSSATQNLSVGTNTFKIIVKSEYAHAYFVENNAALPNDQYQTLEIVVTITKNAKSSDNYLKELYVEYTDTNGTQKKYHLDKIAYNGDNNDLVINNSNFILDYLGDGITNVTVGATAHYSGAKVNGNESGFVDSYDLSSLVADNQTGNYIITVTCKAEDNQPKVYKILIPSSNVNFAQDNNIDEIIVTDSTGTTHLSNTTNPKYDQATDIYGPYKIPYDASSYTITVVTPTGALSTVTIDGQNCLTKTESITASMRGTTKTVIVYCTSQDSTPGKGTDYKITLEFEEGSKTNTLDQLLADNTLVPNFASNNEGPYELTRPNNTTYIDISYLTTDTNAKVVISGDTGNGRVNLVEGVNTITVTVIPQDTNSPSKNYTINVLREYPLPYLTDLKTTDGSLLDTNNKVTTFDKQIYYYNVIVPYYVDKTTIQATVDNVNYTVSCNNANKVTDSSYLKEFETSLQVGANKYVLTVTSPEGKLVEYNLTITRRPQSSMDTGVNSMDILQIPAFKTDYTDSNRQYSYNVPNGIRELDVKVDLYKKADSTGDGATYKIINGRESGVYNADEKVNLRVGKNTLLVLVIAEDGETTRAVEVEVYREAMSFNVDTEAYASDKVTGEVKDANNNIYTIDLGDKRASDVSDWSKFITFDETKYDTTNGYEVTPDIEVLSDTSNKNCSEVIIRLSDGDEEVFVTLSLESTAIGGFSMSELLEIIIPWILLLIAIILLIAILVCVNRDKYGSINKRRKKDEVTE